MAVSDTYSAKLTSFHTACQDNNPFTVYVVTVRKDGAQWKVFRRYKEWEDLRVRMCQVCGGAPPMPGKMLFGRMRPEVIETRVLGLHHFLQMALATPQFSCPDLADFLEREKNMPPTGLDLVVDPHDAPDASTSDGSALGTRQAQLKRLVESTSQAFIPVSQEPPTLDAAYLAERTATYAATLRPATGPAPGSKLSLSPPPSAPPSAAVVESLVERLLLSESTSDAAAEQADATLVRSTAAAAATAVNGLAVQSKHEVLVTVG